MLRGIPVASLAVLAHDMLNRDREAATVSSKCGMSSLLAEGDVRAWFTPHRYAADGGDLDVIALFFERIVMRRRAAASSLECPFPSPGGAPDEEAVRAPHVFEIGHCAPTWYQETLEDVNVVANKVATLRSRLSDLALLLEKVRSDRFQTHRLLRAVMYQSQPAWLQGVRHRGLTMMRALTLPARERRKLEKSHQRNPVEGSSDDDTTTFAGVVYTDLATVVYSVPEALAPSSGFFTPRTGPFRNGRNPQP